MLVDSHCHLDFPDFADELDGVVGARAGGRRRPHGHDLDARRAPRRPAGDRRALSRRLLLGRHPSAQRARGARHHRRRAGRRARAIPRWWRSARPGSTITTTTARATRRSRASARISPRRARPGCRWSSIRATPTTTWRAILEEETGKGAFPAVLHCFTGGRDLARRAVELGLYVSFSGILTFKKSDELRAIAGDLPADRLLVETDAPYLAPGPFRGKRNEPAYVVETAKVLAEARGVSLDEIARQTTRQFLPAVRQGAAADAAHRSVARRLTRMTLKFTILGCGSSGGVPRPALGWGACDPDNPKNRRRRCFAAGRAPRRRRRHARPGRHLAGPARAAARRRRRPARRRALSPTSMPTTPTASTTCGRCSSTSARARRLSGRARPRATMHAPLRLLLRDAARQRLSADRDRAPARARPSRSPSTGEGGADRGAADPAGARRHPLARLPLRRRRPIPATSAACRTTAWRRWPGSTSGSSTRCATGRIRAISASTRRWAGSSA